MYQVLGSQELWLQVLSNIFAGVMLAFPFTIFWGVMVARRESVQSQITMLSAWLDEATSALLDYFQFLQTVVKSFPDLDVPEDERERLKEDLAKQSDEKGRRLYVARARVYTLKVIEGAAGSTVVKEALARHRARTTEAQRLLNALRPFDACAQERLDAARKVVEESLVVGAEPLEALFRELRFWRIFWRVVTFRS